jgi:hypothetical protein
MLVKSNAEVQPQFCRSEAAAKPSAGTPCYVVPSLLRFVVLVRKKKPSFWKHKSLPIGARFYEHKSPLPAV